LIALLAAECHCTSVYLFPMLVAFLMPDIIGTSHVLVLSFLYQCSVTCRYLPPHFPQDKPILKVVPPVSHSWVDDKMTVTGCYSLNTVSNAVFLINWP